MKTLLYALLKPKEKHMVEDVVNTQTLHLFRVKLLEAVLLTAALVGLGTGMLEWLQILPKDMLYTPVVIVYSFVNFIAYLTLKYGQKDTYFLTMHICIFSALATFAVMSMSLLYDEFRFIWFFLLSFASYMLGGKRYGMLISFMILSIIYVQFFTTDLRLSPFALFTFSTSFLTFNVFSVIFLNKIEQDSRTMQTYISQEVEKRKVKENMIEKIHEKDTINLKNGYLWDSKLKRLTQEEKTVVLTQKEQQLLALLIKTKNTCVTFEDIQVHLWEDDYEKEVSVASVKVQVTGLRRKLPKGCIKNVYGCGYIFHS